jgi:hypothetical protein
LSSRNKMDYQYDSDTQWKTLDGRSIPIRCLTDVHLANVIYFVKNTLPASARRNQLLKALRKVANTRGLKRAFLDAAPMPWQDVDGQWLRYNEKKGDYEVIGR